jgi:hypothetical protein
VDEATFKATVNLEIGIDVQAYDADLSAIAALGFASTSFLKKTAADTWALDTNVYEIAGAITPYTDEMAQDAAGAMIGPSLQYTDATPLLDTIQDIRTSVGPTFDHLHLTTALGAAASYVPEMFATKWDLNATCNIDGTTAGKATFTGSFGIGGAPSYPLDVTGNARITTFLGVGAAPRTDIIIYALFNQTANTGAVGIWGRAANQYAGTFTGTVSGVYGITYNEAASNNNTTAPLGMRGVYGSVQQAASSSTVTGGAAFHANITATGGTARAFTNAYGVYVDTTVSGGGSIGTLYGFYMPTCGGTTRYGVYIADAGAGNNLLGWLNVGAGTAAAVVGHLGALRFLVNPTAYLDGANAGRIGVVGTFDAFTMTAGNTFTAASVTITGGSITGITDLAVADGGTNKSAWTQYAIPYLSTTTAFSEIAIGAAGKVLTVAAGATGYEWTAPLVNPMTNIGDIIYGGAGGAPARLADVATGYVLASGGVNTAPFWANSLSLVGLTLNAATIATDIVTGLLIGNGATRKLGFWGATPVVQAAHIANASDLPTCVSRIDAILVVLENMGATAMA